MKKTITEATIIDCGSKHNLPLYITIANAFKIPFAVVHDSDITNNSGKDQKQIKLNQQIKEMVDEKFGKVFVLDPDFETVSKIDKDELGKKGKPLVALDHFSQCSPEKIPGILKEIVEWMADDGKTKE